MKPLRRLLGVLVVLTMAVALSAAARLHDLRALDDLKAQFNRDAGKVRIVLLLSPT